MRLVFQRGLRDLMYYFEVELLVNEKLGRDLGRLLLDFIREDPKPWIWPERPLLSPWELPTCVDPDDGIDLPLFAP